MKKNDGKRKNSYYNEKEFFSIPTSSIASCKPQNNYAIYTPLCKDNLVSKYISQEGRSTLPSFKSNECNFSLQKQSRQLSEINDKKSNKKIKKKSIYKGVFTCGKKFKAQIQAFGVQHYLGLYKTAEEAARSYDSHARMMLGNKAKTNFQYEAPVAPLQEKKMTKKDKNLKRIYVGIKTKKVRYNYPSKQFYLTKEKLETIGNFLNYFGYKLLPANQCSIVNHSNNIIVCKSEKDSNSFNEDTYRSCNYTFVSTSSYSSMNFLLNLPSHNIIKYNSLPIPSNAIAVSNNLEYLNINSFITSICYNDKTKNINEKRYQEKKYKNNYYLNSKNNNLSTIIYNRFIIDYQQLYMKNSNTKENLQSSNILNVGQASNSSISSFRILHCIHQPYYEVYSDIPCLSLMNFNIIPKIKTI